MMLLLMVIVCSESLGWDIYNNSKKKGLFFSLKLTWKPVALCLSSSMSFGFFFKLHLCEGHASGGGA